jgi:hypothetical protein
MEEKTQDIPNVNNNRNANNSRQEHLASLLLLLVHEDPGTYAVAGVPSNDYCCWQPLLAFLLLHKSLLLLASLMLLLVCDDPGTSAVAGVPSIAIIPELQHCYKP